MNPRWILLGVAVSVIALLLPQLVWLLGIDLFAPDPYESEALARLERIRSRISIVEVDEEGKNSPQFELDLEKLGRGLMAGRNQHNYQFINRQSGMRAETWAGIRDNYFKSDIVRVDAGHRTGKPHVNIDPRGYPNKRNPHIPLPTGAATVLYYGQRTLQTVSSALFYLQLALDSKRLAEAASADYEDYLKSVQSVDEITRNIGQLKAIIRDELSHSAKDEKLSPELRAEFDALNQLLKHHVQELTELLDHLKQKKAVPKKTILAGSQIGGGFLGGYGGGSVGSSVGSTIGGTLGWLTTPLLGPAGPVVGAWLGAVTGAVAGGIAGGKLGSEAAHVGAETVLNNEAKAPKLKLIITVNE